MLKFNSTLADATIILQIAQRAAAMDLLANGAKHAGDTQHHAMNITACHLNGNPLDLLRLLAADDFNFAHDIFGIDRHIDRKTGKLPNCFSPQYSARQIA